MIKRFLLIFITVFLIIPFVFISLGHTRPPKPGPNFIWVPTYTTPDGTVVPGHWKYDGTVQEGKEWVPGHYNSKGVWVPGHWKNTPGRQSGKVWVPGHYGARGRWIPGHWR
jgi:hypothetical protein